MQSIGRVMGGRVLVRIGAVLLVAMGFSTGASAGTCSKAVLPVTLHGRLPTVPVTLNGRTVAMAIDSGAQVSVVTPETATELQLPTDMRHYYSRVKGTSGAYVTVNAIVHAMNFAGVDYRKKRVNVVQLNAEHPAGAPLKGLIGADILTDFAFEYDVPGKSFTFFPADGCAGRRPGWKGNSTRVPFSTTETNAIAIPVIVNGHRLTGVFDTGANITAMTLAAAKSIGITREMLAKDKLYGQMGISGNAGAAALHRFDTVTIAGETFHNSPVYISNFSSGEADLLIGEDYMFGHRFRVSYADQVLYMQDLIVGKH